ncbi:site-specific integrase [Flexivirga alba]|uniref:Site-specific integrase n=1 Tax=Flexivirga alba TaxID=702742 RepID=A0ABW2AHV3_9MICO
MKPVERYLEFLRATGCSPNTIKAYARGLALWWTFLEDRAQDWETVGVADVGAFAHEVRQGPGRARVSESTVALRVRSVLSFYRFHAHDGVTVADSLYENIRTRQRGYLPFLEHIARRDGRRRSNVRVRVAKREVPIVTPLQALVLRDTESTYDVTTSSGRRSALPAAVGFARGDGDASG